MDLHLDVADAPRPLSAPPASSLAGDVRRGIQDLTVAALDQGGGLTSLSVLVNGVPAAAQGLGCATGGGVAYSLTPCQSAASPTFELDTQAYPFHDGPNSVQVCATDLATLLAPNLSLLLKPNRRVDNSCEASQVGGGSQLSAAFEDSDEARIEVTSKKGATVTGRLTDDQGTGIGGATLCVRERTLLTRRKSMGCGHGPDRSRGVLQVRRGAGAEPGGHHCLSGWR